MYDLGFINCDKFYDQPMTPLNILADKNIKAEYYIVFKDVKGAIKGITYNDKVSFGQLPKESSAKLIAISFTEKEAYMFEKDIVIDQKLNIPIRLEATSEHKINQCLASLK